MFIILTTVLTGLGCFSPKRIYHATRVAGRRASAIPLEQMAGAIDVQAASSGTAAFSGIRQIVVLARDAEDASGSTRPALSGQPSPLGMPTRQFIETTLQRVMMSKGYQAVNRLTVIPVEIEKAFPLGDLRPDDLRILAKASHILLCTRVRQTIEPEKYIWRDQYYRTNEEFEVGRRVTYCFTLELLDSGTSESLWTATATIDTVFKDEPNHWKLLDQVIQALGKNVPAANGVVAK